MSTLHAIRNTGATLSNTGWVINQTAIFRNLDPAEDSIAGLVSAAYNVLLTNDYYVGKFLNFTDIDPVSGEQWPIVLDQLDFSTLSQDTQEVGIIWRSRRNGPMRVQFSTGAVMEQTNMTYGGSPIVLKYKYPNDPNLYGDKADQEEATGVMMDKLIPERTVELTRTEWGPTYGYNPGYNVIRLIDEKKHKYEGHTNLTNWSPIPGLPPRPAINIECWLCTGINATTNDGGLTYDVSYSFVFRDPIPVTAQVNESQTTTHVGGWVAEALFIDPGTGRPPSNLGTPHYSTYGNAAYRVVPIYQPIDFSQIWVGV